MRSYLDAFAAGFNAYSKPSTPTESLPEAKVVLPITGVDVVAHWERVMEFLYIAPAGQDPGHQSHVG